MTLRKPTMTVVMAGVALAALAVGSCGQKPAPAETAEGGAAAGAANAEAGQAQSMRVTHISLRDMSDDIEAKGRLVVREEASVGSELAGYRVQSVYVDEGDWVKPGQALAKLDDTLLQAQIAQAEATLATQKATVDFKKSQFDRSDSLTKEGAFSKEQNDQRRMEYDIAAAQLLASQAAVNEMKVRQARMTLRAPVGGVILQRTLRPGDISGIGGATPYFRIAREGLVELDAELPDAKLAQVKEGDAVVVTLPTGEVINGKVRFVSPRVSEATSLGRARVELPYNAALRAGSFAQASFNGSAKNMLTVASSAVRYEAGGPGLMVVDQNNRVRRVPVKLGERMGDFVQLVEGPPAGTRVLTVGASFTLEGDVIAPVDDTVAQGAKPAAQPAGKQGGAQ